MRHQLLAALIATAIPLAACAGDGAQTSATTNAPPAVAAAPAVAENVQEVIAGLEQEWVKAILAKDTATVDRLLMADFTGATDSLQYGKSDALEDVRSGTHETLTLNNIVVHAYGDVAIATMDQTEKSRHGKEDFSGHFLFTDVWVKRDGQWRAVASHGSRVR
ncbi:MAG: nuclear transport factor 2 family protein [Vicinamibacterales bacterium]